MPQTLKLLIGVLVLLSLLAGCASAPVTPDSTELRISGAQLDILETCKRNLAIASPDTLRAVLNLLEGSEAGRSEAGTEYEYIAAELLALVYPVAMGEKTVPEAPSGSIFPKLFSSVKDGKYPEVDQKDISFFSILAAPVSVLFSDDKTVENLSLDNIEQAVSMNDKSVLPVYLRGYIDQKNGRYDEAFAEYTAALDLDQSCYPAELGIAGIYEQTGRNEAAAETMDMLAAQYPFAIKILLKAARARYRIKDYQGALDYAAEVLRLEPDNAEVQLLRARIFLVQNNLQQALRLIEVLERMNYLVPDFYYIKSEVQKGGKDYLSALNTLEKGRKAYPGNKMLEEAYGAVLMLAGRKDEAREILAGEGGVSGTGEEGLIVLINDAIDSKDWNAAAEYAEKLAAESSSLKAGSAVWSAWYSQNNYDKALAAAEKVYEQYPDDGQAVINFIRTLLKLQRRLQAERIINERLPNEKDPEKKSTLYFLKSLVAGTEDDKLQALRSSLFENLQNVEALVGISELYTEMGDYRKAYRYLKQAAILKPEDKAVGAELKKLEDMLN